MESEKAKHRLSGRVGAVLLALKNKEIDGLLESTGTETEHSEQK